MGLFEQISRLDIAALNFIQTYWRCGFLDFLMPKITALGNLGFIWILAGVVLLCLPKHRKSGALVLTALLFTVISGNLILKPLVGRIRPFDVNPLVELLIARPLDLSFPSGHSSTSFAAAFILFRTMGKPMGIIALVLAGLIAFSRIYLYVHYPTDILMGALLGVIMAEAALWVFKKWGERSRPS